LVSISTPTFSVKLFVFFSLRSHPSRHLPKGDIKVFQKFIFIPCWEQWAAHYELVQYSPKTPHINSVVILYPQHNFGGSVVPALHVEEAGGAILTTSSEIYDFNSIEPLVSEKYVLWFHIAMDNLLILHIFEPLAYLPRNNPKLLWLKDRVIPLVQFLIFVKVVTQAFKNNDDVLPEFERVDVLNKAVFSLVV